MSKATKSSARKDFSTSGVLNKSAATIDLDKGVDFVTSTDEVDSYGDIVKSSWILARFKKNPIALAFHRTSEPIGTWKNVRVSAGKLVGTLMLAKQGTSEFIDGIRSLVEQRILKAVSVGFQPGKHTPIDEEKPWNGMILENNTLLEISLVSVPANASALAKAAGSLEVSDSTREMILKAVKTDSREKQDPNSRTKQHATSQDSDKGGSHKIKTKEKPMSLAAKIKALQASIKASRKELDVIEALVDKEDRDFTDDELTSMDTLVEDIDASTKQLDQLKRIESSKAARVKEEFDASTKEDDQVENSYGSGARQSSPNKEKGHRAMAVFASVFRAFVEQRNPIDVAKAHYSNEPEIALLTKAVTTPANTGDAAWAGDLVQTTWGEFLELLRSQSIYAQLPGLSVGFDGGGALTLPRQQGRGNLSGAFTAEGAPIPVKAGAVDSVSLSPKGLKVISSFTREMAMRSNPSIENMIRNQILDDTAELLDAHIMSDIARDTINPGGIQDDVVFGADNINASAGTTAANIESDLKGMMSRLISSRFTSAVWVLNPIRVLALATVRDAASGAYVYKDEISNGMLMGQPYISSGNVPDDVVGLFANNAMAFASEQAPEISASASASLHYEDTTPQPLVDDPATPTDPVLTEIAAPVRSLFQTDSVALRMTEFLDHTLVRANGVQALTGVAWT